MEDRLNNPKHWIFQLLCKHDGIWCKQPSKFGNLSGERHYKVCRKCGKTIDERFIKYD